MEKIARNFPIDKNFIYMNIFLLATKRLDLFIFFFPESRTDVGLLLQMLVKEEKYILIEKTKTFFDGWDSYKKKIPKLPLKKNRLPPCSSAALPRRFCSQALSLAAHAMSLLLKYF